MNIWPKLMKYLFPSHLKTNMLIYILLCIQNTINSLKHSYFLMRAAPPIKKKKKEKKNENQIPGQNHIIGVICFENNI